MQEFVSYQFKEREGLNDLEARIQKKFNYSLNEKLGLGLYISKSIIEAHNGKIWAENNFDGKKGVTFGFSLPLSTTNYG